MAELESELQCLRETELQLQSQIEAGRQREYEAIRLQNVAEKEYWDLHDEVQEIINREKDRATNDHCSSPLPPPPVSWAEPLDTSHRGDFNHCDVDGSSFPPPPPPIAVDVELSNSQRNSMAHHGSSGWETNNPPSVPFASNVYTFAPTIHPHTYSQALRSPFPSDQLGPSSQQLAARQVVNKELPIFSGDPIDWPLFISSYRHSTDTCGYTNSENLLRLQRSLKGSAKDSVSSFLLHPSTVPQVVSTLQQLYGRPEQIVNNMIAKVRATPPPKPDRYDTRLVVQNFSMGS